MTKLADDQSGSLNSVMVCSIGSVNAEWLVNLHAGVRSHVFYTHESEAVRVAATTRTFAS